MKISIRSFLKATATGIGSATLAGLGAVDAEATQFDQVKTWDDEAEVVVPGIGAAGLMTAITAYDKSADVLILEKALAHQGGGNILECLVFGRIAGEQVAAEKPWGEKGV